ncbi:hypothetical protein BDW22DRAFT_1417110 [Trametopsis cervina]|nr:hypothetical protein BDW22DRAFT_1417110 [Trametopsis cervina]
MLRRVQRLTITVWLALDGHVQTERLSPTHACAAFTCGARIALITSAEKEMENHHSRIRADTIRKPRRTTITPT